MIKRIIELISSNYYSFSQLLYELKKYNIRRNDLINYLIKIEKICKIKGWKLIYTPSVCKNCGFKINEIKPISRCPKCKSEKIEEPKYFIEINYGNKKD